MDDDGEVLRRVVVQPQRHAEAGPQGRREQPHAGRRAGEGEGLEIQLEALRVGSVAGDDVDAEVLDGGIEVLLHHGLQAMDLVDEQDVRVLEPGEQACEDALVLDGRPAGGV